MKSSAECLGIGFFFGPSSSLWSKWLSKIFCPLSLFSLIYSKNVHRWATLKNKNLKTSTVEHKQFWHTLFTSPLPLLSFLPFSNPFSRYFPRLNLVCSPFWNSVFPQAGVSHSCACIDSERSAWVTKRHTYCPHRSPVVDLRLSLIQHLGAVYSSVIVDSRQAAIHRTIKQTTTKKKNNACRSTTTRLRCMQLSHFMATLFAGVGRGVDLHASGLRRTRRFTVADLRRHILFFFFCARNA